MNPFVKNLVIVVCVWALLIFGFVYYFDYIDNPISASVTKCTPNYVCGEWGGCIDGISKRYCADTKCLQDDIIERRFCKLNCVPNYVCGEWGECVYTEKIQNVFEGKLSFVGYEERNCEDPTGCGIPFKEERFCEGVYNLDIKRVSECGVEFLVASDPSSNQPLAKLPVNSIAKNKIDIVFVQSETVYCPTCYNGILDGDEKGIDCGGSCRTCVEESFFSLWYLMVILLGGCVGLFFYLVYYTLKFYR
jgi:hypothetical protein